MMLQIETVYFASTASVGKYLNEKYIWDVHGVSREILTDDDQRQI